MLLPQINDPQELKSLSVGELAALAEEIRQFLIEKLSVTGGHLASNLGVVELTLALHYCYDSPRDKMIYDVGHQAYVHKILTGRQDRFDRCASRADSAASSNVRRVSMMSGKPDTAALLCQRQWAWRWPVI